MKSRSGPELPADRKPIAIVETLTKLYGKDFTSTNTPADRAGLLQEAEQRLKARLEGGDEQAGFLLGQLYFEQGLYEEARALFEQMKDKDPRALYQLAVMDYDGLGAEENHERAVAYMHKVATFNTPEAQPLKYTALYNLGWAYLEGFGVRHSDTEAERMWLLAADDGNPKASVKAQSALGMFYCRPDSLDLKKSFFWHSEACGNGSVESQAALGVMYLHGQGIRRDTWSAFQCLKEAAERGSVYAQGHLVAFYYSRKMYSRAAELASRIAKDNIPLTSGASDRLPENTSRAVAIALFHYGRCLYRGVGVEQNKDEAKQCFSKAAHLAPEVAAELQMDMIYGRI